MEKEVVSVRLEELWPVMKEQLDAGGRVKFGPKGTSMLPMLRQGTDSVEIEKAPERLKKYDLPLYRRESGQFVLHRIVGVKKDGYVMRGDNQTVREYGIKSEQILAVVSGFWRGEEYIGADDVKYRRYCRRHVMLQSIRGNLVYRAAGKIKRILLG